MIEESQLGKNHPDADQLSSFSENALPLHEREMVLLHLAACAECREVVDLSSPPMEAVPEDDVRPAERPSLLPWFTGWKLIMGSSFALAGLAFILVLHRQAEVARPGAAPQTATNEPAVPLALPTIEPHETKELAPVPQPMTIPSPPKTPAIAMSVRPVPAPPAVEVDEKAVANLPLNGRNYAALPAAQPSILGATAGRGAAAPMPVPAAPIPPQTSPDSGKAPNTLAQMAVTVDAAADTKQLPTTDGVFGMASSRERSTSLPSHLPPVSEATAGDLRLALDDKGSLFASADAGRSWKPVKAPWNSRAVRVLATFSNPARMSRFASPTAAVVAKKKTTLSITGVVTDSSGAVVPGATVTARGTQEFVDRTGVDGRFQLFDLPAGAYHLQAAAPGFLASSASVEVSNRRETTANLTLSIGAASQTVTVNADSLLLNEAESSVRTARKSPREPARFAVETAEGERWLSSDGEHWKKQ